MDFDRFLAKTPATLDEIKRRVAFALERHPLCRNVEFDIVSMPRTARGNWTISLQSVAPDALWEQAVLLTQAGRATPESRLHAAKALTRLAHEFLEKGLVDRLVIFHSPITLGRDALSPFQGSRSDFRQWLASLPIIRRAELGEDVMSVYALREA